jgi:hypothetical protein
MKQFKNWNVMMTQITQLIVNNLRINIIMFKQSSANFYNKQLAHQGQGLTQTTKVNIIVQVVLTIRMLNFQQLHFQLFWKGL